MASLPRVSCLIHTYNHAPFLARAIESVLAQDYPTELLEIIVIDDESPDATPQVVLPYLDRIRYIRKAHGGQGSTANPAFGAATGELIAGMDGDDVWMPYKVRKQVEIMQARPQVGLVYGDMQTIDRDDRVLEPSYCNAHGLAKLHGSVFGALLGGNPAGGSTTMVRAALLPEFFPIPVDVPYPDWWTALRIARVAEVEFIDEPLIRYRYHGGNWVMFASGEKLARLHARELPFRRQLIWDYADHTVALDDLLNALLQLERTAARAAQGLGRRPEELLTADAADRAAAAEAFELVQAAWRAGAPETAARWLIRGLSRDFWNASAHAALSELIPVARAAVAAAADTPAAATQPRATTVLAHLDELLARPELADTYLATFSADDPVTLLVYAPNHAPTAAAELLSNASPRLVADNGPDVELVAVPAGHEAGIAKRVHAVLSFAAARAPFDQVSHFDPARLGHLKRLVSSLAREPRSSAAFA